MPIYPFYVALPNANILHNNGTVIKVKNLLYIRCLCGGKLYEPQADEAECVHNHTHTYTHTIYTHIHNILNTHNTCTYDIHKTYNMETEIHHVHIDTQTHMHTYTQHTFTERYIVTHTYI